MRVITFALFLGASLAARADTVCVKYGPCPLDLSAFACTHTTGSSFVRQVCYDQSKRFMVIKLNETWYPYCEVEAASVQALTSAPSVGTHFNQHFRSAPGGTRGPFDCREHPMPAYGP
jgi:hypothetical protein